MKSNVTTFSVETGRKQEMLDLTGRVEEIARSSGVRNGLIAIHCHHTTAGMFVGEYQSALNDDVQAFLGQVVPDGLPYKHNSPKFSDCERQNAASHIRSLLLGHGVLLPLAECVPVLGQFQSVILTELDGPRKRTLQVQVFGE